MICAKCKEDKPEDAFGRCSNPRSRRKRQSWCKRCHSIYCKERNATMTPEQRDALNRRRREGNANSNARAWRAANPERSAAYTRKYRFGITHEQYVAMLAEQEGKCAVCREREATHVDHDHACCPGKRSCGQCVRGVLCFHCNAMLGLAADDLDVLMGAVAYLMSSVTGMSDVAPKTPS